MILDRRNLKLESINLEYETNCKVYDGYVEDMLKSWWDDREQRIKNLKDKNKI